MPLRLSACQKFLRPRSLQRLQKANNFIVLLPKIPECSAADNELLRMVQSGELPVFNDKLRFKDAREGVAKLALEYEMHFHQLCKTLENLRQEKRFETVFGPLVERHAELEYAWGTLKQLVTISGFDDPWKATDAKIKMKGLKKLISRCLSSQFTNGAFYRAVKEVMADPQLLDMWQRTLCTKYLQEAELNGVNLSVDETKTLLDIRSCADQHMSNFWLKTKQSSVKSSTKITQVEQISEAPQSVLFEWAAYPDNYLQGPHYIPETDAGYVTYLQYCNDRNSRYKHYFYWNAKSGFLEDQADNNNSSIMEELRLNRNDEAKLFKFDSYSELRMKSKMAYSLDEVEKFLTELGEKAKNKFTNRLEDWKLYAKKYEMVTGQLKPWDYFYYARKLIESAEKFDNQEFSYCMPYDKTWKNLLLLTEQLFGVKYVNITDKVSTWHDTVRVLSVQDANTGEEKGIIYVDSVARPAKVQTNFVSHGRSSNDSTQYRPIVYMNFNALKLDGQQLFPMSRQFLLFLARAIGDALSIILSDSPYSILSSTTSTECDAERMHGRIMKWLVLEPQIMSRLSDNRLSVSDADIVREVYLESALPVLLRDAFLSEFDLIVNCSPSVFWLDIYRDLYLRYYGRDLDKYDKYPCSFVQVFTDSTSGAGYYSKLWSEMIACNVVAEFREAGALENPAILGQIGQNLRSSLFSKCGGENTRQLFREFRGRDLEFSHLHDSYKLNG